MVKSSHGFSIEIMGKAGIKYFTGDAVYFIDSEMMAEKKLIAIETKKVVPIIPKIMKNYDSTLLIKNTIDALHFLGYRVIEW